MSFGTYHNPDTGSFYLDAFYAGSLLRLSRNEKVDVSPFESYRTNYDDVKEIVDDRYFVPSSVAVTQRSRSFQGLYDSPDSLSDARVVRLNASLRHPSMDIVDVNTRVDQLKKITLEFVDSDKKRAVEAIVKDSGSQDPGSGVVNTPSDVLRE